MKTDFQFSNLLGTVYRRGNLLFTPDGTSLLSPVGNRVTVFDLVHNTSYTLPFAHRRNIIRLDLSPQGNLLLTIDEDGQAILTNFPRRLVIHHFSFKGAATALSFSPSGRHFAVGVGRRVQVWKTPKTPGTSGGGELEFAPFVLYHDHAGHFDDVTSIQWSSDSRFFLSTSKDLTTRIWSLGPVEGFTPTTLSGHRETVVGAWFTDDQERIYTVSQDGAIFSWAYTQRVKRDDEAEEDYEPDERWRIVQKNYFMQTGAKVKCASLHAKSNLLVVGFSNGLFGLYEMPDFNSIHLLSISQSNIDFVTINNTGEWLAFGSSRLGQLLVWEWQSESYILKQQGHLDSMNTLAYSPDGTRIITASDDGKIKVWDVQSGFCIVTFTEHTGGVTACQFAKRGNVLFTASLDGSIRAWDLIRYRNFRTFTAPTRLSFSSLALDPSGEVVCAGSLDSFDIHIWSVQTGQLLDQMSGHEGPVSTLAFTPDGNALVSGSWDHTVRIWNIFSRAQTSEPLQLQADLLSVAVRPDSLQVAASTLDGQLTFWDLESANQTSNISGRRDISGGRKASDRRTAANSAGTKSFGTIAYSADGTCLLAAGNSKYICLYAVSTGSLLKKYTVSVNLSLDGTQEFLNSKRLTEAGPDTLIDDAGESSDLETRRDKSLPGVQRSSDPTLRTQNASVRVTAVDFSPTARSFCAASSEGLLVYSLDSSAAENAFDPFDLDISITPATIATALHSEKDYLKAIVMAFRLNEAPTIRTVYETIPHSEIPHIISNLPIAYLPRLLRFITSVMENPQGNSPHVEFNLRWLASVVRIRGAYLKERQATFAAEMRSVGRVVQGLQREIGRVGEGNAWLVGYLIEQGKISGAKTVNGKAKAIVQTEEVDGDEEMGDSGDDEGEWMGVE